MLLPLLSESSNPGSLSCSDFFASSTVHTTIQCNCMPLSCPIVCPYPVDCMPLSLSTLFLILILIFILIWSSYPDDLSSYTCCCPCFLSHPTQAPYPALILRVIRSVHSYPVQLYALILSNCMPLSSAIVCPYPVPLYLLSCPITLPYPVQL